MTTVYRERDRYDDTRSAASTRRDDGDRTYKKVTRYIVREDDDARSSYTSRRRDSPERETQTIRITRRERDVDDRESVASPRRTAPVYEERDIVIRKREDDEEIRSPRVWERRDDTTDRELVIRKSEDHGYRGEADRESVAIAKVDDRRHNYDAYDSGAYGQDRDLRHYTRTAEYYGPAHQPQTIIIRQDPIIIRERVRDDDYQMVRKSDIDEERSVATTRREDPRDEEFFYEKRVRERFDDPRYDDYDRRSRREISPHDSVSQVGRRRDRSYSSDESMVYVKRKEESYSRESSTEGKKDLAAGVIAGVGASELLRNHRKKEGRDVSHGAGRVGRDIGAGAIGAIAAEGIRRYRSKSRHGSRERDRSDSRERKGRSSDHRGRSRSRSGSRPSLKTLGALGLGAVAVAAAASVATRKMDQNKSKEKDSRRSRSRRRRSSRGSVESLSDLENDPSAKDARNPSHRNSRMAAAGAVGAAGAALIERARSKSRGREGSRERSRIQKGLPIALTGLGTAALAGLYEKNKAKQEAVAIQKKQKDRARSQSRDNRSDAYYDDRSRSRGVDPGLVEYGHGDVTGNNFGPEYYGRAPPPEPYYADTGAMVPTGRRSRSRSLSRDRRGLRSASPGSEQVSGSVAAAGAAAGAVAASEHEKRKQEKRERKARRRAQEAQEAGRDPYEDAYAPQQPPQQQWTPPPNDPYASQQGFGGPQHSPFPAPPGSMPPGLPNQFQPQYQPSPAPAPTPVPQGGYTPQNAYAPQPPFNAQAYPPPPGPGMPPAPQGYHDPYNAGGPTPYPQQPRNRGTPDENVSAGNPSPQHTPPNNDQRSFDGVNNSHTIPPAPVPPAPTPAILVHPPTNASTPSLNIPPTYVPPLQRSNLSQSHLPSEEHPINPPESEQGSEKRVQFAPYPESSPTPEPDNGRNRRSNTMDSDNASPDFRRQQRRQQEHNRGYDASDDTDLSPDSERRANRHRSIDEQLNDRSNSRRERTSDRSLNPEENNHGRRRSTDHRDRRSSRSENPRDRESSPTGSDTTIDLPARFDDKGRRKSEKGDDPLADKIDDILKGKGSAGRVFGNFMDGLFGPEGRSRSRGGDDAGEGGSRRKRDKDRD